MFGCRGTIPHGCSRWCINPLLLWRFLYSHGTRRESTRACEFSLDTHSFLYSCYSSPLWVWTTNPQNLTHYSWYSQNSMIWPHKPFKMFDIVLCCSVISTTEPHNLTSQAIQDIRYHLVLFRYHKTPWYELGPCPCFENFHLIDRWSFSCVWGDKALDPCVVFCSVEVLHTVSLQGLSITNWDFMAGVGICVVGFSHPWTRWNWALHWHLHLRGGIRICRCTRARRHVWRGFIHACSLCSGVPQKQKQNK